ncbi:receptor-type tyrosine-protein phosphatase epsilon-like [Littorina saxatilis]|uniref:receptor-type tyrosine-protein phosphatase epsilon-like n=1 Tax=Littorina saxatilis TaxID=31220 RepID=UPI0038B5EFEF
MGSEFVFTSMLLLGFLVFVQFVTSQNECDCRAGCNLNETCYNSECTLKNVAVGKVANSSPVYGNQVPCLAVDGIINADQCTETAKDDLNPFWRVDLGQEFIIRFMTVYRRWAWSLRMVGLKIYVEDQLCDVIEENETTGNTSSVSSGSPVPISITCGTPLTGRYVTLVKNTTQVDLVYHREILSVCEVQVWAPTTTPPTPTPTPSTEQTEIPLAVIAGTGGAVVAVVIMVIFLVVIIVKSLCLFHNRRKRGNTSKREPDVELDAQEPVYNNIFTVTSERDPPITEPSNNSSSESILQVVKAKQESRKEHNTRYKANETPSKPSSSQTTIQSNLPQDNAAFVPEGEVTKDEVPLAAEDHVYQNREEVYSKFRSLAPQLDSVQTYLADRLASQQLCYDFIEIPKFMKDEPQREGLLPENKKKNRFSSVIPYDKNRVSIHDGFTEGLATDYVNASYIRGYKSEKDYIAAQGPNDKSPGDFWRMVWQEGITQIVMLTNLKEGGKDKCFQYWPEEGEHVTHGPVTVSNTHVECRDSCFIRTLTVSRTKSHETREVTQYHYSSWPDHGVPTTVSLVMFWRDVANRSGTDEGSSNQTPKLVHCSAGVGRTGTFIGLDLAMQRAVKDGQVDLVRLVTSLREQRCLMVQTLDQFLFLHSALLEAYTLRDYVYHVDTFSSVFSDLVVPLKPHKYLDLEFKMLMEMRSLTPETSHKSALDQKNMKRNRNLESLPVEEHLVRLSEDVPGRNHYVNAVFMPTFRYSQGSIATQLPFPSTLVDFWRLINGNGVKTIVSLGTADEEQEGHTFCKYWPREEQEKMTTGPYTVTCLSVSRLTDHLKSYSLTLNKTDVKASRSVTLLHYNGWTGKTGGKPEHLLHLVDTLVTSLGSHTTKPYVVQCLDGVDKSGLFNAMCYVINRMTYDRIVDVFMTVRHVQSVTPNAVTSEAQYRYLYEAAQQKCHEMSSGVYANEDAPVTSDSDYAKV